MSNKLTYYNANRPMQIKDYLAKGNTLYQYCYHIGVCKMTIYHWKKKYPEFVQAIKEGKLEWKSVKTPREVRNGDYK